MREFEPHSSHHHPLLAFVPSSQRVILFSHHKQIALRRYLFKVFTIQPSQFHKQEALLGGYNEGLFKDCSVKLWVVGIYRSLLTLLVVEYTCLCCDSESHSAQAHPKCYYSRMCLEVRLKKLDCDSD